MGDSQVKGKIMEIKGKIKERGAKGREHDGEKGTENV